MQRKKMEEATKLSTFKRYFLWEASGSTYASGCLCVHELTICSALPLSTYDFSCRLHRKRKAGIEIQNNKKIIRGLLCLWADNEIYFGLRNHFNIGSGKGHQRTFTMYLLFEKSTACSSLCLFRFRSSCFNKTVYWGTGLFRLVL